MNMKEHENLLDRYHGVCDLVQELENDKIDLGVEVDSLKNKISELENKLKCEKLYKELYISMVCDMVNILRLNNGKELLTYDFNRKE